jgi:hypothetical protein
VYFVRLRIAVFAFIVKRSRVSLLVHRQCPCTVIAVLTLFLPPWLIPVEWDRISITIPDASGQQYPHNDSSTDLVTALEFSHFDCLKLRFLPYCASPSYGLSPDYFSMQITSYIALGWSHHFLSVLAKYQSRQM